MTETISVTTPLNEPVEDQLENSDNSNNNDENNTNQERPAWLPEKFKTPEDFAKSYKELESKFTKENQESDKPKNPKKDLSIGENEDTKENEIPEDSNEAKEAVEKQGIDFTSLENEFLDTGTLSEETYKELESKGFPKEIVDNYIAGQQAQAEKIENQIYDSVGGKETYQEMIQWAKENLSDKEISAFDSALDSDMNLALLAVNGLKAKFENSNGSSPKLLNGESGNNQITGETYDTWEDYTYDYNKTDKDGKYLVDVSPKYRKQIEAKLARSNI